MKDKYKISHILVIVLGAIFVLLGAFHNSIWFDEAYTVGLVSHNFKDIIQIGIADVHPVLYYILLKIFTLIFGNSFISIRIFSVLGAVLLSVIGYTHIKKDFGKKVGIIFSLFSLMCPIMTEYASEMRMYTWASLFVFLTFIYAYRVFKDNKIKDWVLFCTFSLMSAYTHYFATISIAVINVVLFIYIIKNKKEMFKNYFIAALAQIVLYIPGLIVFVKQGTKVAGGFWINITYPDILVEMLNFHFNRLLNLKLVTAFSAILYIYLIYRTFKALKQKEDGSKVAVISLVVFFAVIIISLIVSIVRDIFVCRYMMPMFGLFIFFVSYMVAKEKNKIVQFAVISCVIIMACLNQYKFIDKNYNEANNLFVDIVESDMTQNDIFVYTDINSGSLAAIYFPNNKQYFYNINNWSVEEAYKAFAPQMEVVGDLSAVDNFDGKNVWLISSNDVVEEFRNNENLETKKEIYDIYMPYRDMKFNVYLFENVKK